MIIVACVNYMEHVKNKIELAFPKYEEDGNDGEIVSKVGTDEGLGKHLSTTIDTIATVYPI